MPLPVFNSNGLLPEGVHPATDKDLHDRCVLPFVGSQTRPMVFDGFKKYRRDLELLKINITQWVDGSFIDQTRLDPEDIDLVNFVNSNEINNIPPSDQHNAQQLLDGRETTKTNYHCHTFLEVVFPAGHVFALTFEKRRKYWRDWWSKPQDYSTPGTKSPAPNRGTKGFVEMIIGNNVNAPKIRTDL